MDQPYFAYEEGELDEKLKAEEETLKKQQQVNQIQEEEKDEKYNIDYDFNHLNLANNHVNSYHFPNSAVSPPNKFKKGASTKTPSSKQGNVSSSGINKSKKGTSQPGIINNKVGSSSIQSKQGNKKNI